MKGEKPLCREEGIGPALMVLPRASSALTLVPSPQDRPKSSPHKAVDSLKRRRPRVFEVAKPAAQPRVEVCQNLRETAAPGPPRLLTNLVPQRLQTLGAHIPPPLGKPVPQKIKPFVVRAGLDNASFLQVETQAVLGHRRVHRRQHGLGFC